MNFRNIKLFCGLLATSLCLVGAPLHAQSLTPIDPTNPANSFSDYMGQVYKKPAVIWANLDNHVETLVEQSVQSTLQKQVNIPNGLAGLSANGYVTAPSIGPVYGNIMLNNDPTGANLQWPSIRCSGNGAYGAAGAYGVACFNVLSNPTDETYALQVRVKNETPGGASFPKDVVAGFFGIDNTPYSIGSWALNPLINDNPDGGGFGAGVVEVDANNINCDNPDPDGEYHTGLSVLYIRKTRTDGSACPDHRGMMITGVAGHTGNTAILIANKPMANGANQFEDGIDILGSTVIGSAEWRSETVAKNIMLWKGTHTRAIDARSANIAYAFASLPKGPGGRIIFGECPDNSAASCTSGGIIGDWYTGVQLAGPMSEFYGANALHQFGMGWTVANANGTVASTPDVISGLLPSAGGTYNLGFSDGSVYVNAFSLTSQKALFNVPLALRNGALISDWYDGVQLSGSMSEFYGTDALHQLGLGWTTSDAKGTVASTPDVISGLLPSSDGAYNLGFADGTTYIDAFSLSASKALFNVPVVLHNGARVNDWYTGVQLSGAMSEFAGADALHQFGLGWIVSDPSGGVAPSADAISGILPTTGSYNLGFGDGKAYTGAFSVKPEGIYAGVPVMTVSYSKAQILGLSSPQEGEVINDSDDHTLVVYESGKWYPIQMGTALSN